MISLRKASKVIYFYTGICWTLDGICNLIYNFIDLPPVLAIIINILATLFLIIGTATTVFELSKKIESEDEMSKINKAKAYEMTLRIFMILMIAIVLVPMFGKIFKQKIVIDYYLLFPFLYGVVNILIGYFFEKFEKEGI